MVSRLVAYAREKPAHALAWLIGAHVVVWTALPILVCGNLPIDLVEGLAFGREWQLGYWKHPPLPWWIDALAYRAAGDVHIVYLLAPVACAVAFYATWRLGLKVMTPQKAFIAVLMLEGLHFFNFTAVKFNHDVLSLPFWALTGLFVYRAVAGERSSDWIASGVFLALCFWTKYVAVVLATVLALVLVLDPFARRAWRTPGLYMMMAAFVAVLAPHFVWLVGNDFLPMEYAGERAKVVQHWYEWLEFPLRWVFSQFFFILPTLVLMGLLLYRPHLSEEPHAEHTWFARRYVTALALGPFLLVTIGAIVSGRLIVAMWGYPLWTFLPLAALMWFEPTTDARRLRLFASACLVIVIAMPASYAASELLEPFLRDRPKATQFPGELLAKTITDEWHKTTDTPLAYVSQLDFGPQGYGEFAANLVAVYSPDHPHVVAHGEVALSPWIDRADLERRGAMLLWQHPPPHINPAANREAAFPDAELLPPLTLPRLTLYPRSPVQVERAIVRPRAEGQAGQPR